MGQFLGFCAWLVSGQYRRLAKRNVAIAFADEKIPREMRRLVRRHFQRLGANLLCSVKLTAMPPEKILRRGNGCKNETSGRGILSRRSAGLAFLHLRIMGVFVGT